MRKLADEDMKKPDEAAKALAACRSADARGGSWRHRIFG